ncbi:hypothetical protein ACWEPN_48730 [Nonomuraea wenchangensis]
MRSRRYCISSADSQLPPTPNMSTRRAPARSGGSCGPISRRDDGQVVRDLSMT